jgi:protein gp37
MAELSKIEWTDHTFNPWIGCTKVSVGPKGACNGCYAEVATPTRTMHIQWGAGKPRHRTSPSTWALPLRYERNAAAFLAAHGRRQRVFCASLADIFDNEVDPQWRVDLFRLIQQTPQLDWLLLTKRIGNARQMLNETMSALHHSSWDEWPWGHVWLGATVVTQDEVDRDVEKLIETPARVRFLSCEPLMEAIEFPLPCRDSVFWSSVHWIIVGGESGRDPRPMAQQWAEGISEQCAKAGCAFFMKQGSAANWPDYKDFSRFAPALQVRQWPNVSL